MDKPEENVKKENVKNENEIKDLTNAIESLKSTLYVMAMLAYIMWYFSSH